MKAVQRMIGHASAATTLDAYSNRFDDDPNAVAPALDLAKLRVRSLGTHALSSANTRRLGVGKMWNDLVSAAEKARKAALIRA